MKTCYKCSQEKSLSEFYKDKNRAGGFMHLCKECHKLSIRQNRAKNADYYRQYDKSRNDRSHGDHAAYRKKYPEKIKAGSAITSGIRLGVIKRPDRCEGCYEKGKIEAHHPDYSQPLNVIWLCSPCHRFTHVLEWFK